MIKGSKLAKGDVYLAEITFPGDKEYKYHCKHVVIIEDSPLLAYSPTVAVLTLTTRKLYRLYPTDVPVTPDECKNRGGAKILSNQPLTIGKDQLINYKYSLSKKTLYKLDIAIVKVMGLFRN